MMTGRTRSALAALVALVACQPWAGTAPVEVTGTPSATVVETENPVASASAPTADVVASSVPPPTPASVTATPVALLDADCLLVERRLCADAQFIRMRDQRGKEHFLVGLRLPVGTAVRSPITPADDYSIGTGKSPPASPFQGSFILLSDKSTPSVSYAIRGDFAVVPQLTSCDFVRAARAGTVLATVVDTGAVSFGAFNITIAVSYPDITSGGFVSDEETLRRLFPAASARAALQTTVDTTGAQAIASIFQCKRP